MCLTPRQSRFSNFSPSPFCGPKSGYKCRADPTNSSIFYIYTQIYQKCTTKLSFRISTYLCISDLLQRSSKAITVPSPHLNITHTTSSNSLNNSTTLHFISFPPLNHHNAPTPIRPPHLRLPSRLLRRHCSLSLHRVSTPPPPLPFRKQR